MLVCVPSLIQTPWCLQCISKAHAQCAHTPDAEDACLVYYMPPSYVCRVSYTHLDRCAYVGACRVWVRRVWVRRVWVRSVWVRRVWVRRVWVLRVWVLLGITVHAEKLGVLCCLMYDMPGGLHALLPYALESCHQSDDMSDIRHLPYALDALSRKTKQVFH